ncbi:hypothetical protein F2P56_033097 [Juglans regia]|uniref:Histidine-containing phosphotransfer protein n=2 Tax=Juglans regia TaxID=51240 RepID=A0A833WVM1_JUGRE|nr:histidine-containing phosphotransfer protein 2-like isoform X3 [Juglans regia]KAF5447549.1 hypothetical protein F2P56_033097 [Juglans regia]
MRKFLLTVAWLRMLPSLRQIFSSLGALMDIGYAFVVLTGVGRMDLIVKGWQDFGSRKPVLNLTPSPSKLEYIFFHNVFSQGKKMAETDVKQQIKDYVQTMHEQGILDHNFENVQNLQCQENPHFVLEIIDMFCRDAEICIAEMAKYVDEPVVDYAKVTGFIHQLKGSSSSVGGCRIVVACRELRKATENKMKEGCLEACNKIKREYFVVRDNLNAIAKMERSIHTDDAMAGIF